MYIPELIFGHLLTSSNYDDNEKKVVGGRNGYGAKLANSFKQYVEMYIDSNAKKEVAEGMEVLDSAPKPTLVHQIVNDRWEVAFTMSDGQFNQVSFVNSIATTKGGTHVEHVAQQIITKLVDEVKKRNKAAAVKPHQIKQHLWIFVNCLIENPAFDSQTKENMTLRPSAFGSKCNLSEDFIKKGISTAKILLT